MYLLTAIKLWKIELKLEKLKGFERNGFPGETFSVNSAVRFRKDFSELCSNLHMCGVRRSKLISSRENSVKGTSEKIQETYSLGEE